MRVENSHDQHLRISALHKVADAMQQKRSLAGAENGYENASIGLHGGIHLVIAGSGMVMVSSPIFWQ